MLSGRGTLGDCRFGYVTAAPRLEKCIFSAARPVDARARQQAGDLSLVSLATAAV